MTFLPGLELCHQFFTAVVQPLIATHLPGLPYAAARIGAGSEVLGFDTPMSMDHDWGPHLLLLLREDDLGLADALQSALQTGLPAHIAGFPIAGARRATPQTDPRRAAVWITTCREHCWSQLHYDLQTPLTAADWLSFSEQRLLELTAGAVYHDAVGDLTALRARLAFYPPDVWRYLLAADWARIGEEEHLLPRAGSVGDELGSAVIGSRLVRDMMHLSFLLERRYAPYPKWFGRAFAQLAIAPTLHPLLWAVQQAPTWERRMAALAAALEHLAARHNALGLTPPLAAQATPFHDRPFTVIHGERFATALVAQIESAEVRDLATRRLIGNLDQWSDSTALRADVRARPLVRALYQARAPVASHAPATDQPAPIRWVWFDVGETLIDETRHWAGWADWLGVPHLTFFAALGAVIAQRQDHRAVFPLLRPGFDLAQARAERVAAGLAEGFDATDLYPDVAEALGALRGAGLRIGIAGNQPAWAEAALAAIGLPADRVAASERWGVHKPDPAFFTRLAAESGMPPAQIAYVGDRLDNDVLPARAAGMWAIFLRRGPWGHIHTTWPERAQAHMTIASLRELPALLRDPPTLNNAR